MITKMAQKALNKEKKTESNSDLLKSILAGAGIGTAGAVAESGIGAINSYNENKRLLNLFLKDYTEGGSANKHSYEYEQGLEKLKKSNKEALKNARRTILRSFPRNVFSFAKYNVPMAIASAAVARQLANQEKSE